MTTGQPHAHYHSVRLTHVASRKEPIMPLQAPSSSCRRPPPRIQPPYEPPSRRNGRGMNGLAVMSLVSVFVFGPLAVILGHMARHQIRRSGESGAGIALGAYG
jgi:hypothetical protein